MKTAKKIITILADSYDFTTGYGSPIILPLSLALGVCAALAIVSVTAF
jgi:hypothetical protein